MKRLLNLGSRVSRYSNVWLLTHVAPIKASYEAEISSVHSFVREIGHMRLTWNKKERSDVDECERKTGSRKLIYAQR